MIIFINNTLIYIHLFIYIYTKMFRAVYHITLFVFFILFPHTFFAVDIKSLTLPNELKIDLVIQYWNINDNLLS